MSGRASASASVAGERVEAAEAVKVEPDELGTGNHDVTVVVQPEAGPPLAKEKATFKTYA